MPLSRWWYIFLPTNQTIKGRRKFSRAFFQVVNKEEGNKNKCLILSDFRLKIDYFFSEKINKNSFSKS